MNAAGRTFAAVIIAAAFLTVLSEPFPGSSECGYLLGALRSSNPDLLRLDWTFGISHGKTAMYDAVVGAAFRWLPLEAATMGGRLVVFTATFSAFAALARAAGLGWRGTTAGVLAWLAFGQSLVGLEWPIYYLSPKEFGWSFGLWGLVAASDRMYRRAGILAGLAVGFHPVVGGVLSLSLAAGTLVDRPPRREFLTMIFLAVIAALPGLLPLLSNPPFAAVDPRNEWRFQALSRLAVHLDLAGFRTRDLAGLATLIVTVAVMAWKTRHRFWIRAVAILMPPTAIFILGAIATVSHRWELLAIFPFRVLPPLALLLGLFAVIVALTQRPPGWKTVAALGVALPLIVAPKPLSSFQYHFNRAAEWGRYVSGRPPYLQALRWTASNTPPDAVLITSPFRNCSQFFSRRAQLAYSNLARFDRMQEDRERLLRHVDGEAPAGRESRTALDQRFNSLPESAVLDLKSRYGGDYLVSTGQYRFPVVFEAKPYRVYDLRDAGRFR